ncbi:D-alanyl-D-alanine carboxypeptidase family protein [Nonomuraea sp. SBT364]|uniref:D-alanyl-D-alanine carboxypeptidase family protein n=1 Tax=Nonomuraea sp. SBT364 TaxID=1580530 RepID=UPI000B1D94B5|nr:D-alanyl-D-alanine carboxypeptidase family protein [Nonomuraea sp. SBT364]
MRLTHRLSHALLGLAVTAGGMTVGAGTAQAATSPATASQTQHPVHAPTVLSPAAYLMDAESGEVHFSKGADSRRPVASITKAMTAYTVLKQAKPTDTVKITAEDVEYAGQGGASVAGLRAGDTLTVEDLLYGLMLPSGADAAHTLARAYGPSVPKFVAEMNATARQLGMNDTRYVNADGMPYQGGGYSTARDQAVLAKAVLNNETLKKVTSTRYHSVEATPEHGSYAWKNTNRLLADPGALGVKTGYTRAAGYTLAFGAERDGDRLVGVILGATDSGSRFDTAQALLDWAAAR